MKITKQVVVEKHQITHQILIYLKHIDQHNIKDLH